MLRANTSCRLCFEVLVKQFLFYCMRQLKFSKFGEVKLVFAIPRPNKPLEDLKTYRPIFLLCVSFKISEKLIYARVEPIIDSLLPREQAGFWRGKSTVDQVSLLIQEIKDDVSAKTKAGAVFVNLIAAYHTEWHRSLTCKLFILFSERHMELLILFVIEVLLSSPVPESKASYDALRMASH